MYQNQTLFDEKKDNIHHSFVFVAFYVTVFASLTKLYPGLVCCYLQSVYIIYIRRHNDDLLLLVVK